MDNGTSGSDSDILYIMEELNNTELDRDGIHVRVEPNQNSLDNCEITRGERDTGPNNIRH